MATTKDLIGSVAKGDLNTANDVFADVMAAKTDDAWAAAKNDVARTAFDTPVEEPEAEETISVEEPETEEE
jgi:hypothetical protein